MQITHDKEQHRCLMRRRRRRRREEGRGEAGAGRGAHYEEIFGVEMKTE